MEVNIDCYWSVVNHNIIIFHIWTENFGEKECYRNSDQNDQSIDLV